VTYSEPARRSADLQSAVSQVCNLQAFPEADSLGNAGRSADYKSAIRQTASLRYDALAPNTSLDLCPDALSRNDAVAH